jgi:hypothetical protein
MAVHVRNMVPMSPFDTGALSVTQQNVDSTFIDHIECDYRKSKILSPSLTL